MNPAGRRRAKRPAGLLFAAAALAGCASDAAPTLDVDVLAATTATAAPWVPAYDVDCVLDATGVGQAALVDLVEHPPFARDLDTAQALAVAVANCVGPDELVGSYIASLALPAAWSECTAAAVDDVATARVFAAQLVGDLARAARALDPLFACVVRTDADVATEFALPGLLATAGLEDFTPATGPACVQERLAGVGLDDARIIALLLAETVAPEEIEQFAAALVDCADPDRAAAVLGATVGEAVEPACLATTGREPATEMVAAVLAGGSRPEDAARALAAACAVDG